MRCSLNLHNADDANLRTLREVFEATNRTARIFIQPIVPDDFRDDVFQLLEVQRTHVVLQKESNAQHIVLPLAKIRSPRVDSSSEPPFGRVLIKVPEENLWVRG